MDKLPLELENIVYRYEHGIKFHKVLDELKKVEHKITETYFKNYSELSYGKKYCQYYPVLFSVGFKTSISSFELCKL